MSTSLSAISIAVAISVFNLLGLTVNASTLELSERGSGRVGIDEIDRGSGRLVAYRGSGRIETDQAYRGSGRLEA